VLRALVSRRAASRTVRGSRREREVLELVAEGRSNKAICERLVITQGAVQKHVSTIFNKLGVPAGEDDDRRILAVLAYLRRSQFRTSKVDDRSRASADAPAPSRLRVRA
jgi:DNA-binding NarL/FixJ family response regulator